MFQVTWLAGRLKNARRAYICIQCIENMSTCTRIYVLGIFSNEFNRKLVCVELIEINCQNSRILETEKKTERPFAVSDRRYLCYVNVCVFVNVANVRVRDS